MPPASDRSPLRGVVAVTLVLALATGCGSNNQSAAPGSSAGAGAPAASPSTGAAPPAAGGSAAPGATGTTGGTGGTGGTTGGTGGANGGGTAGVIGWDVTRLVDQVQPQVVAVQTDTGEGSGVVARPEGVIVTNHHVIEGAAEVSVAFLDGETEDATVVASDPRSDLAVLRVDRAGLPSATFMDGVPDVGALAVAMGNPLGFEGSVSLGIVSGLHRAIPGSPILVDLVQTDAAISPGNSGGALVGADGRIIGINVAYIPPSASAVSIGFAIPAPTVTDVVDQLLATGTVRHAYLGARLASVSPALREEFELGVARGAILVEVERGGPAASAGLQTGDVVTRVDGQPVDEVGDLLVALRAHAPGDRMSLEISREGETQTVDVTLGEVPAT